ncbi:sucrose-6-phosphate hydrolase SacC (GH32 family) [Neobacillus bataviensis]|uniref:beta-fructofuranosidase n=1 Tax=Neobacillus bataviensis TaxID=220685 RepID=A0A561DCB4_9BACI|nr:GH32 C-terminal domain-containing protein [Neobacillus bataviensis]TWE01027.1 sucrose-6-phosphate hydrolase SacC (GH32 family) [Neobacillus bataviensis]
MDKKFKNKTISVWLVLLILMFTTVVAPVSNIKADVVPNDITNGSFETGDLTGWTVVKGGAFGPNSVSNATTWWNEKIPYNHEGNYHLDGWAYPESETGILRSSTFQLGGTGWISFKLGGGKNTDLCNIQVYDADTKQLIAKYGNTEFADKNFPHVDQGMNLANMVQYRADLSAYKGKNLYIEIVDNAVSDWGLIFADAFKIYYETVPTEGTLAIDLSQTITNNINNPDFETGDLSGWQVTGNTFGVSDVEKYWQTHNFNQHGKYHVWGFIDPVNGGAGDDGQGEMRSNIFKLGGNGTINFLVGGGNNLDNLYVALVSAKDGKELFKATGNNDEGYTRVLWDASAYRNQYLYIKVVDKIGGGFGHINVDDFHVYNVDAPISDDITNPNFETGDLSGWNVVSGDAFVSAVTNAKDDNGVKLNINGEYHLWDKDSSKVGVLKSSEFVLGGTGKINMLLAGGADKDNLYVALVNSKDNTELIKVTNSKNNVQYSRVEMDASQFIGQKVYLKIVDNSMNAFGYINVDDIHVKNDGTAAFWKFDEQKGTVARDSVSGIDDYVNYVFNTSTEKPKTGPLWKKGILNNALLFDGYSTWISRSADKFLKPSNAITISAWVAPRTYEWGDLGQDSIIVNQQDKSKSQGFGLGIGRHGSWDLQLGINNAWFRVDAAKDKPIPLGKWSYVTATYDMDSQSMRLYLNGELAGEKKVPVKGVISPSTEPLIIGKHNQPAIINGVFSANMFDGLIDELNISYAPITAEQVKDDYNSYLSKLDQNIPNPQLELSLDSSILAGDRYKPQFHYAPPQNWMNEPHAPIYYNGKYHIFYQANPRGPYWHYINWGHAVSTDLVHWKEEPIALMPQENSVAPDGVWSGSATYDKDGKPVLFFTAGNDSATPNQSIGLATAADYSNPELPNWNMNNQLVNVQQKDLLGQNAGETAIFGEFRDPFVFKNGDTWVMLVGSGIQKDGVKTGGTALVYTSKNLTSWDYKGPLFQGNHNKHVIEGTVWELPVFLPLKDSKGKDTGKYIMLVSPTYSNFQEAAMYQSKTVLYWIGKWDSKTYRFTPDQEAPQMFDYGMHFSGPSGFVDQKGRTIVFSIAQDSRSEQEHYDAGWAHNAGLPLQLTYDDGKLGINPISDEFESLHDKQLVNFSNKTLPEANALLKDVKGDMLDIQLELQPKGAKNFGIKVRRSPDGQEETMVYYDASNNTFNVNKNKTSLNPDSKKGIYGGKLELDGKKLKLHIYLDRSMIEAYANGSKSITTRAYPVRYDSLGLQIYGDGNVDVKSMQVWSMKSAYGDGTVIPVEAHPQDTKVKTGNIENAGFETGDLTGWTVKGNAFSNDMVTNAPDSGWAIFNQAQRSDGSAGYHLWGFKDSAKGGLGDSATGSLKSSIFKLAGDGQINFLVGGGKDTDNLYVALVRASDNTVLLKATGNNSEQYSRVNWNASKFIGEELYLKVVDNLTGGFGHINVDDIHVPVQAKVISDIPDINVATNEGEKYVLPQMVEAIMSDGSKEKVNVTWSLARVAKSNPGNHLYTGTVSGYDGEVNLFLNIKP